MFTGIIEERGRVASWATGADGGAQVTVHAPIAASDARHGDSIAVSGVCLTVVDRGADWFTADVMGQTLAVSALADAIAGTDVNLERAAQVGDRLGGHIVQGHVDGVGVVLAVRDEGAWRVVRVGMPADIAPLVVDKGSIAVAGVSLTVSAVGADTAGDWFEVSLIPETLSATTLGQAAAGTRVNLESDILARHVRRMLSVGAMAPLTAHPAGAMAPEDEHPADAPASVPMEVR